MGVFAGQDQRQERIQELGKQLNEERQKETPSQNRIQELRKQVIEEIRREEAEHWPRMAAAYKGKGQLEATIWMETLPIVAEDLSHALQETSVVVATPTDNEVSVAEGRAITTWRSFRAVQTISEGGPKASCLPEEQPVVPAAILRDELGVPFMGGTVTVDGVRFTQIEMHTGRFRPSTGVPHLMFVTRGCNKQVAFLVYGRSSMYPVATDGTILPSSGDLAAELAQLGTIERLRDYVARLER